MATDWAADVKKYDAKADETAIAGIVRYCGIALRNRDSSLVSFSDKAETDRVRNNFLKKKLGLTQSDAVLDAAIAKVGERMKADRTKNRVTVYYLLAAELGQLGQFAKAAPAAKKAPATKTAKAAAPAKAPATKAPAAKAATTKAAPKTAATKPAAVKTAAAMPAAAKPAPVKATAKPAAAKKAAPAAKAPAKKPPVVPATKAAAPAKKAAAPAKKPAAAAKLVNKPAAKVDAAVEAVKAAPAATVAAAVGAAAVVGAAATGAASMVKDAASGTAEKVAAAVPAASKPAPVTAAPADDGSEMNWLWWVIGLAVLAFLAWWWFSSRNPDATEGNTAEVAASAAASDVGTDLAAAPAENTIPIPQGAGVTSEMRDGKPVVKVYFDSGKTDVTTAFGATAGGLKSWLDTHSGATLAVSGYSDPSGNAAVNAELAKQRAQAVQSALVAAGIPATSAALVKPDAVIDATTAKDAARRVEIVVK
jgi:outer membrane protein OmpA-like peptidoglycan-associated protein